MARRDRLHDIRPKVPEVFHVWSPQGDSRTYTTIEGAGQRWQSNPGSRLWRGTIIWTEVTRSPNSEES